MWETSGVYQPVSWQYTFVWQPFASCCVSSTQLPSLKDIWDLVTAAKVIKNWHKIFKARDKTDAGTQYVHMSFVVLETQQISSANSIGKIPF